MHTATKVVSSGSLNWADTCAKCTRAQGETACSAVYNTVSALRPPHVVLQRAPRRLRPPLLPRPHVPPPHSNHRLHHHCFTARPRVARATEPGRRLQSPAALALLLHDALAPSHKY